MMMTTMMIMTMLMINGDDQRDCLCHHQQIHDNGDDGDDSDDVGLVCIGVYLCFLKKLRGKLKYT